MQPFTFFDTDTALTSGQLAFALTMAAVAIILITRQEWRSSELAKTAHLLPNADELAEAFDVPGILGLRLFRYGRRQLGARSKASGA